MSRLLADLNNERTVPYRDRIKILGLRDDPVYDDGRTKQCHKNECDINKIMARFDKTGTISHVNKYEATYSDFSDFDFHEQITKLAKGEEIFEALPAEVRREFNQSPADFFNFVNDPANADDLINKLPALAAPGNQLPSNLPEPEEPVAPVPAPAPAPE